MKSDKQLVSLAGTQTARITKSARIKRPIVGVQAHISSEMSTGDCESLVTDDISA